MTDRDSTEDSGSGSDSASETSPDSGSDSGSDTSSTSSDTGSSGSAAPGKDGEAGISDDQLPEDLQPTDDNPLAKPPSDEDDDEGGMSLGPDGPQG